MDALARTDPAAGGADEPRCGDTQHGAMLWSVKEACERQTLQIGASACGATAVLDAVRALGLLDATEDAADRCVRTRLRRNESPLPDYLLSRSEAGATHVQLVAGAEALSGGRVAGRFFHLHPPRRVQLGPWLAAWICRGAVPVATMNMQAATAAGEEVPDAWHHQLVFGVAPDNGVFMTNPLDLVSEAELQQRLCSESVLLIRREDVLQRSAPPCVLSRLQEERPDDPRWTSMDVQGQVRQMVLEEGGEEGGGRSKTTHIVIPAAYRSGVTVFALRDSDAGRLLLTAPDLPLL